MYDLQKYKTSPSPELAILNETTTLENDGNDKICIKSTRSRFTEKID